MDPTTPPSRAPLPIPVPPFLVADLTFMPADEEDAEWPKSTRMLWALTILGKKNPLSDEDLELMVLPRAAAAYVLMAVGLGPVHCCCLHAGGGGSWAGRCDSARDLVHECALSTACNACNLSAGLVSRASRPCLAHCAPH